MSGLSPFAFMDAVSDTKVDMFLDGAEEKDYNAFLINRGLSYHMDAILYVAELNTLSHLPNRLQFDYLRESLRKRKRFSKWSKKDADLLDKEKIVSRCLNISPKKAREIFDLLTDGQIQKMREEQKT